ncbi:hypothetical protein [Nocardia australiensis]|uniref:hypothetical protein n=1 Tax=Nocardia australiensis TaxID=2887191 RepID=UPI001D14614A|nr:hypothetical protein [Nocardia australiensis]
MSTTQGEPHTANVTGSTGSVISLPTIGGPPITLATVNVPVGIAVSGTTLYVTESTGNVVSLPTSGGTPTTIATGLSEPAGIAV